MMVELTETQIFDLAADIYTIAAEKIKTAMDYGVSSYVHAAYDDRIGDALHNYYMLAWHLLMLEMCVKALDKMTC